MQIFFTKTFVYISFFSYLCSLIYEHNRMTPLVSGIVPLWCSERYDSIYHHSSLYLIEGENHLMVNHLNETKEIISAFLNNQ